MPQDRAIWGAGEGAWVSRGPLEAVQFVASLCTIIPGHALHLEPPASERAIGPLLSQGRVHPYSGQAKALMPPNSSQPMIDGV